jgi:hypothetical protein
MLMNTKSQRRVSLMSNSDSMLKEISTLCQLFHQEDTLILLTTETWLLRQLTEERLKSGTSTNKQRPLELDTTTSHGISRVLVEPTTCKSGALTQDGSRSSNTKENSSPIQPTTRFLMSQEQRMKKVKLLSCMPKMEITIRMLTKDGKLFILTKLKQLELKVSTKNSASTSTDLSTSDQDSQCKELLSAMELTTCGSRDGGRMLELSNGTLMKCLRPSELDTTTSHGISRVLVGPEKCKSGVLTQDGSKYSNIKMDSLSILQIIKFLMFTKEQMKKVQL